MGRMNQMRSDAGFSFPYFHKATIGTGMQPWSWMIPLFLLIATNTPAASLYVNAHSPHPSPPYSTWETAAQTIQDAIDSAVSGDEVVVTNGVYNTGGKVGPQSGRFLTNRICVTLPISIRSMNGPDVTIIEGQHAPGTLFGITSVRCALLAPGSQLHGFTLQKGSTGAFANSVTETMGGAVDVVLGDGPSPALSNCVIQANSASQYGGGVYEVSLLRCVVRSNWAGYGGGAAFACYAKGCAFSGNLSSQASAAITFCTLDNSLVTENQTDDSDAVIEGSLVRNSTIAFNEGGVVNSTVTSSIIFHNKTPAGKLVNYSGCKIEMSCTSPLPPDGAGNTDRDPQLVTFSHLGSNSPCLGAGTRIPDNLSDLEGIPWGTPPSMGCTEFVRGAQRGPLRVRIVADNTNAAPGCPVSLKAEIIGRANGHRWDFGDGIVATNQPITAHAWLRTGVYPVSLTVWNDDFPEGVVTIQNVNVMLPQTHYVNAASTNPLPPFISWSTAATVIQDAVDVATPGSTVLVTNGVYRTGGRSPKLGAPLSRVTVTKPLTLQSVNGAPVTVIEGAFASANPLQDFPVRCAYLKDHVALSGFTLTQGGTYLYIYAPSFMCSGGGIWCESTNVSVSDCVLSKNQAGREGGGAMGGTFRDCLFQQNSGAYGGGAFLATLEGCTIVENQAFVGEGANTCLLSRCKLLGQGGSTYSVILTGCLVAPHSNSYSRLIYTSLYESTLVVESPSHIQSFDIRNCLIHYTDGQSAMGSSLGIRPSGGSLSGTKEFLSDPGFVDAPHGDYHLRFNSPAVNAGIRIEEPTTDLDGNSRIVGGKLDLGAYEVQSFDLPSYEDWLRFFSLPRDGAEDTDRDGVSNQEEWQAGTDPTNPRSALKLNATLNPAAGLILSWAAIANRTYRLEETDSLENGSPFHEVASGVWNKGHTAILAQWTNAITPQSRFYRIQAHE